MSSTNAPSFPAHKAGPLSLELPAGRGGAGYSCKRPPKARRRFVSEAVERTLTDVAAVVADEELRWLFTNCLPNTLDTTITLVHDATGRPDAFVITGDIAAMWLRDSTNQVWPYLALASGDANLMDLFRGLINRQAACVRIDPYANSFYRDSSETGEWQSDHTEMRPGVHERKYELDSLCAVLRLACGFYFQTGDTSCFDAEWLSTVELIVQTIRHEQAGSDEQGDSPVYQFRRTTPFATDTLTNQGNGNPFARTGMSRCAFRPSDDATTFQHLVPANAMAVVVLRDLAKMLGELKLAPHVVADATALAADIDAGIREYGIAKHRTFGDIYAYEVDGFGGVTLMDDANVPSLLALPYLGYCGTSDPLYQATRAFVLSGANPYFFQGDAGEGVGGPHVGPGYIWPMAVVLRALTSQDDAEILACLRQLKATHADTGFMHESYWKNDPTKFTRSWFAWANSLFGELILHLHRTRPHLLATTI